MTEEFGPFNDDDEPDRGLLWTLGGWVLSAEVWLFRKAGIDTFSFDRAANRISAHGESDNPRDPFDCGYVAALLPMGAVTILLGANLFISSLANQAVGTPIEIPMAVVSIVAAMIGLVGLFGVIERIPQMTVYDHTTEPTPDVDDINQQYLDGEIDEAELEARKEARL